MWLLCLLALVAFVVGIVFAASSKDGIIFRIPRELRNFVYACIECIRMYLEDAKIVFFDERVYIYTNIHNIQVHIRLVYAHTI